MCSGHFSEVRGILVVLVKLGDNLFILVVLKVI